MNARRLERFGKKAIAVLMALCLSVMMVPAVAFASIDSRDYEVEVDATAADASATQGNISTTKNGVGVVATGNHTGTATVGDVAAGDDRGVYVRADGATDGTGDATTNVTAGAVTGSYKNAAVWLWGSRSTGNVTVDSVNATIASNGYNKNYGIYSDAGTNADLSVKVNGGVTIPAGVQNYTTAVYVKTTDPTAKNTVEVGDVNVTDADRALYVDNYNGGSAKLTAGDVTATDVGSNSYQESAICANANNGTAELTMGDLKGLGDTYVGMKVYANHEGKLTVNAGDISVEKGGGYGYNGSYALDGSTSDAESVADITVGDISAKHSGVNLTSYSNSSLKLKTGDISGAQYNNLRADGGFIDAELGTITGAQYTGLGISGTSAAGSQYNVTTESITSEDAALSFYTYATESNPDKITVNGDLTSAGGDYHGAGIYASSSPGYVDLTVNGNVTSDYYTITGTTGGTVHITGDVISTHDDDYVPAINDAAGKVPLDLLVEGTISANGPALTNNAENYSRLALTTWKVSSARSVHFSGDDEAGTFAKTVNYIAKVEQPKTAGVTLQAVKADGSALATSHDLPVAHEGDKVYLKATLPSCVKVAKAYNGTGDDKVELPKDENGYYYEVPRGGGIYLSADLEDDHNWEVSWRWDGDVESGYTACTALFHCTKDSSHDMALAADVTSTVVEPTCTEEGYTRYTATVPATASPDGKEYSDVQDAKATAALGHDWGAWKVTTPSTCSSEGVETRTCTRCNTAETRAIAIDPNAHEWGDWQVTREPTPNKNGVRTRVCKHNVKHKQTESIPASGKLLASMTAKGKKAMTIAWTKMAGASGYEIYFAKCNHNGTQNVCKKVKTIKSGNVGKFVYKKKLKAKTSYKMFVMAFKVKDGQKVYADTSLTAHAYTSGGTKHFTNPKKVTVKQSSLALAKGQTATIEANVVKLQKKKKLIPKNHTATIRYISSNKSIAKVSKDGLVTAKKKGSCKVYAIAANGVRAAVKVTVA